MDRFDALQLFLRIVDLGSFTRAAEQQGLPRATATHAIKALEARLGTRLLERTTRSVRVTPDGQAYYARTRQILADLDEAEATLGQTAADPRGTLRIDMSGPQASRVVLPRIDDFRRRYPRIELVVSSGDRLVDLVREGVDVVIRAGTLRDSALVAKKLADMPQVLCASPAYLAAAGPLAAPDDLPAHRAVRFFSASRGQDFPISLLVEGRLRDIEVGGWISVNDADAYVAAALAGAGLIQLPRFHVADALVTGRLVEVLDAWPSPPMPISGLYPPHRQVPARLRVFMDWVTGVYQEMFGFRQL